MANNMLIRTRREQCKAQLAVVIRVILFFGIPSFYLLFLKGRYEYIEEEPNNILNDHAHAPRHLLAISEATRNCTNPAILEFPQDGFTRWQRQHGFIAFHCILAVYCFLLLGAVCEQYFVPAIKIICANLDMTEDIAGATFMAAASSSPELFINCVGTFVTEGDLGLGAVVGSAVFNVLAVPACCGLLAGRIVGLDWWSVSRDCLMYAVAVVALILTLLDNRIYWHEALLLVLTYILYILAMIFNEKIGNFVRSGCCGFNKKKLYTEITPLLIKNKVNGIKLSQNGCNGINKLITIRAEDIEMNAKNDPDNISLDSSHSSLWSWPTEKISALQKCLWILTWPTNLLLWLTIPDCRKNSKLYILTFIMCICWIGGVSYLVAWIITIIGDTINIPDSITGLTFLAAGTSLPEAVSSVVVTNQGYGSMGLSNSIGSNTFDILLCLGLPWFIKSLFYPTTPNNHWITINSNGLSYSAISLLTTLIILYGCLAVNKFNLDWRVGSACAVVYGGFLILAALIELNVFFVVNLPVCAHE